MPYTQNIIIILFASLFVVGLWYTDKEIKNIQANIKIIQNMLKVVLSNQNSLLKEHNPIDTYNQMNDYIPYPTETVIQPPESVMQLHSIAEIDENDDKNILTDVCDGDNKQIFESINSHEIITEVTNESILNNESVSIDEQLVTNDELPVFTDDPEPEPETIDVTETTDKQTMSDSVVPSDTAPKKKRQYRKKVNITV